MKALAREVEAFLALEETLRFAAAAERCHLSTSAFSQMIARLEAQVGAILFKRDSRTVSLTPAGHAFARGARRIRASIAATLDEVERSTAGQSGRISIAAIASLCASLLPSVMARFRESHPDVALELHDAVSGAVVERVRDGSADIGVATSRGDDARIFQARHLLDESFCFLCRENDALARHGTLSLRQLTGRSLVSMNSTGLIWDELKQMLRRHDIREAGVEVDHFTTLAGLVENDFGQALVPRLAVPICLRAGLVARPLREPKFRRSIFLLYQRERSLPAAALHMMEAIQSACVALATAASRGLDVPPVTQNP